MSPEAFAALIQKLEQQAVRNPVTYQQKVIALALVGNLYVGTVVVGLILIFLYSILLIPVFKYFAIKLSIGLAVFIYFVFKAMWLRSEPPHGLKVTAQDAPELFEMIESLRRQLNCPAFHHVLITDDLNAGVVQIPRLGLLGWPKSYLLLGLPLMKLMSREQLKSVLAHEFGHLSRGHSASWIYRQRRRWGSLVAELEAQQRFGTFLFRPFLSWFYGYFAAYSFPMVRANEYDADATAVRLTSAETVAQMLTGLNVANRYLEEKYWPSIFKQADDVARPNFTPYLDMATRFHHELDADTTQNWLQQALNVDTDIDDTHPALKDRLKAVKRPPQLLLPEAGKTAEYLLGASLATITNTLDMQWLNDICDGWQQRYQQVQHNRSELARLDELSCQHVTLSTDDAWLRAHLTNMLHDDSDEAIRQLEVLLQRDPKHVRACFLLGELYLERDDQRGCQLIEQVIQSEPDAIVLGTELLRDYYWRNGQHDLARQWHERLQERYELLQKAEQERQRITIFDKIEPHGLPNETIAQLSLSLGKIPGLRKVYLVRKQVKILSEIPCYILGYQVTGLLQLHSEKRKLEVEAQIGELELPQETFVINIDGDSRSFESKFKKHKGRIL